jgi:hypothetical protein
MVNLSIRKIISEGIGAGIWWLMLCFFLLLFIHVGEYLLPTSFRFEYEWVVPSKQQFLKWETLSFISDTTRHRPINMERQDTAYCKDSPDGIFNKHKTQKRPEEWTELVSPWKRKGERKYFIPPYEDMTICKMCWSAIGTTSHWYKKTYTYCTEEFEVNK